MGIRVSGISRLLLPLLPALAFAGAACVEELPQAAPPRDQLYFPSGAALSPEGADGGQLLLVASSNFDLRYRAGVLHAFDVAAIDELVANAPPAPNCPAEAPRCSPAIIGSFGEALVGAVEIGSFAGEVAIGERAGAGAPLRAFVPVRNDETVVAVDVDPAAPGVLSCVRASGDRCVGPRFPRRDPFSVVAAEGNVYVGHVGRDNDDDPIGGIGAALVDAPFWAGGEDGFAFIGLADEPIGGLAVGGCADGNGARRCTLYATGRSVEDGVNPIYLFDFAPGQLRTSPVFARNLFAQQRGFDTRGVAVSTSGDWIYVASRFPSAVATVDVTTIERPASEGCVVPPGELVPPEGSCPGEAPITEPRLATANLVPAPAGTNAVVTIPRMLPDGTPSDLVVVTTEEGLWFYDTRTGLPAGSVEEVGTAPAAAVFRLEGAGARLYVPSFGHGTLAVVDVPDLFRPASARVVAILGRRQEGAF